MINLFDYHDEKYLAFNSKIVHDTHYKYIGIRVPKLKEIASALIKNNKYQDYLTINHEYFEEVMIHGLIIGDLKCSFNEIKDYLEEFVPLIDNWQVNDVVAANLKVFKTNQSDGYNYILELLKGNNWSIRLGLVLLLDYYVNDQYVDNILDICINTKSDYYYVMMANSWLISMCYIKYPKQTIKLLKNKHLNNLVVNKAISKICDSYRVTSDSKEEIKKLRR